MAKPEDTRTQIQRMVRADPSIAAAEIARQAGVSRERVSQLLDAMGYELVKVWRKKKRRGSPDAD